MEGESKRLFYNNKIDDVESLINDYSKKLSVIVRVRLITLLFFLFLGKKQSKIETKKVFYENLKGVYLHELKLLNRDFKGVDTGEIYQEEDHNYSHDLDMFGVNSIYQILNRSCTLSGKEKLSKLLNNPFFRKEKIIDNQLSIKELFTKENWCYDFLAYGKGVSQNSESIDLVKKWLHSKNYFDGSLIRVIKIVFPIVMVVMSIFVFLGLISWMYLGVFFLVNLIVTGVYTKKINEIHGVLSSKYAVIEKYIDLIKSIEKAFGIQMFRKIE